MSIIETLLRHGAIADLADKYGSTPYSVATARGHPEVASVLHQHACMQRGLQVITPDADYRDSREKDAFASPRTSGDFSRRVSAIMAPTRSSTQQSETPLRSPSSVHGSSITSTATGALAAAAAAAIAASARFVGQRRVSLPSIVEAPSSPIMAAAPRQSCDLSRVPLLNEPLDPRKDSTGLGRRGSTHQQTAPPQVSGQGQDKKNNDKQERKLQGTLPSSVKSLEVSPSDLRRKSVDTAATHLSPPPTRPILRRASFDQLAAMRPIESKTRRDSDASNSETVVSSPSSCSTLASPIMQDGNDSRIRLDKIQGETSAMARSTSQPPLAPLESGSTRRTASASEPSVRRSFDIRLFASSRDHALSETEGEEGKGAKNGKDYKSYRRRSVQDPWTEGDHDERSSFLRSVKMTPSASDSSFHDSAVLDRNRFKHRTSLSGSATISGRFSRLWSHYSSKDTHEDENFHDKQDSTGSTGSLGSNGSDGIEFTDKDALGTKGRAGMMNRLSGMWTRR
ncbi:hypothetical protein B0O80DRAFT_279040 [Mortierella sp. GBAus27b]|nr:hypothetical protein B0O80DRAFT_279040 [Mortierella sp. GBAus27b]